MGKILSKISFCLILPTLKAKQLSRLTHSPIIFFFKEYCRPKKILREKDEDSTMHPHT